MMTSRAWLVDLIHSIGEKLALCDHLAENLDDKNVQELYAKVVEERRKEMQLLVNSVDNPNLEYWCGFKHALKSWVLAQECYDTRLDEESANVAQYSADILAGVMALFLGLEFKTCARCLNDQMLAKYNGNNERSQK